MQNPVCGLVSESGYRYHEAPHHGQDTSDKSTPTANGAVVDKSTSDFANAKIDAGLDESESENHIFDEMVVPSHLVGEAADLLQYYLAHSRLCFEQTFAHESSLSPCDS